MRLLFWGEGEWSSTKIVLHTNVTTRHKPPAAEGAGSPSQTRETEVCRHQSREHPAIPTWKKPQPEPQHTPFSSATVETPRLPTLRRINCVSLRALALANWVMNGCMSLDQRLPHFERQDEVSSAVRSDQLTISSWLSRRNRKALTSVVSTASCALPKRGNRPGPLPASGHRPRVVPDHHESRAEGHTGS